MLFPHNRFLHPDRVNSDELILYTCNQTNAIDGHSQTIECELFMGRSNVSGSSLQTG